MKKSLYIVYSFNECHLYECYTTLDKPVETLNSKNFTSLIHPPPLPFINLALSPKNEARCIIGLQNNIERGGGVGDERFITILSRFSSSEIETPARTLRL